MAYPQENSTLPVTVSLHEFQIRSDRAVSSKIIPLPLSVPNPPARNRAMRPVAAARGLRFAEHIDAPRPVSFWHLTSLDAPTVAIVWSLSFGWMADLHLPLWVPLLLALTVWPVYVGDRLLDARVGLRDARRSGLQERHYFHWRHRQTLLSLAVAAACSAALIILFFMPAAARAQDSVLAAASLAYFACVHVSRSTRPFLWPLLTKELLVGILFTLGCAEPTLRRMPALWSVSSWPVLGAMVFFALLAWLNCSAIDAWESSATRNSRPGLRTPFSLGCLLAGAGAVLALRCFASNPHAGTLLLAGAAGAALLAWLDHHRNRLRPVALRACADLSLLTPVLFIPLTWIAR